ncbi:hypothetical protein EG328_009341 [Venturia inaequalis]|uniref:Uncharacterized protein n=1 Tax=Venturia inaequalis TaxID=5025 RepID=A0A8H3VSQ4_VENIN|nr:hypothetical protein EG328_009341 [Venturia inaequalis]KAE9992872.1 hypothetical protein EG327_007499 [Venturia inaequalis]RDI79082.1 hypothetical protein Vi05172_g10978 [Venturia inaequalis]
MAAALAILVSLVLPGLKKVIIMGIDKLPGEPQPPLRVLGLLHQFPLELRQQVLRLTAPLENYDTDPRSYEPLRVKLLFSTCLYQTADRLPGDDDEFPGLMDRQPPIQYKPAYRSLLMVNRKTHIDMMSTITTEAVQAIQKRKVPKATLVIDYCHHDSNQTEAVYVAWLELPLYAHAFHEIDLDVLVLIPYTSTTWDYSRTSFGARGGTMTIRRISRAIIDTVVRVIQYGVHLENSTPLDNPINIRTLDILLRSLPCECPDWKDVSRVNAMRVLFYVTDVGTSSGFISRYLPITVYTPFLYFFKRILYTNVQSNMIWGKYIHAMNAQHEVRHGEMRKCSNCPGPRALILWSLMAGWENGLARDKPLLNEGTMGITQAVRRAFVDGMMILGFGALPFSLL